MSDSLLYQVLHGKKPSNTPVWFMRQAGRYLPEYRELRKQAKGFLNLCYTPELAAEVTLQPIRRFDFDAAIIFSDILVIPHALGQDVTFVEGEGPRLTPVASLNAIEALTLNKLEEHLSPVFSALTMVRSELSPEKELIGFCGAPFTVASYMIEGKGSKDYQEVRSFALKEKKAFTLLIEKIVEASILYLSLQINAGASIIQIFDSWSGVLSEQEFEAWSIAPVQQIVFGLKQRHPTIPVIGFPRGAGVKLLSYTEKTGVNAMGIDTQTPLSWAKKHLTVPLQGNLDPIVLAYDKALAISETTRILTTMSDTPHIFNLGHGILQQTPIENVQAVCDTIRKGI